MKRNFIFALLTVVLLPQFSSAQNALTLDEAVKKALGTSPAIQKSEARIYETKWKKRELYSAFLPSLSATGTHLLSKEYVLNSVPIGGSPIPSVIPIIVPDTNLIFSAQYPLFDGLILFDRWSAANHSIEAADYESIWAKFRIQRDVELAFYKTIAAQQLLAVAEQNVKTLLDHLRDVQLFQKSGMSTKYDVLRVEVQLSDAQNDILAAQDQIVIWKNKLAEVMGQTEPVNEVIGTLPVVEGSALSVKKETPRDNRTDLLALKERTMELNSTRKVSAHYWFPKFYLFGQYQVYNNINDELFDSDAFKDAYQLGVMMQWNIFDGALSIARAKQASYQKAQAEQTLREATLRAGVDEETLRRKFQYFSAVYRSKLEDVKRSTESVRLAKEGRRVGVRTSTELLDAELDLFKSQAAVVNAQIGGIESLIQYELATGENLLSPGEKI
jgi:outer membrane protein TolC